MKKIIAVLCLSLVILAGCKNNSTSPPDIGEIDSKVQITIDDFLSDGEIFYSGGILKLQMEMSGEPFTFTSQNGEVTVSYSGLEHKVKNDEAVKLTSALTQIFDSGFSDASENSDGDFISSGTAENLVYEAVFDKKGKLKLIEIPAINFKLEFK